MEIIKTREQRFSAIFLSRGFLLFLFILLVNDFLLKGLFGNWFTGKLSDFAGLFIFPLALTAVFPRYIKGIHIATALVFCLFKSSLASPLISLWNSLGILHIGRVIDYTDLIALPMIAVSYMYALSILLGKPLISIGFSRRLATNFVLILSLFSFGATSRVDKTTPVKIRNHLPYCSQDILKVLHKMQSQKKEDGMAGITHLNKESMFFEISVTSKQWKHVYSDSYKDVIVHLGIKLEQKCDSGTCVTIPRFACDANGRTERRCVSVHHKGAPRAQEEIDRFWERLQKEMVRSGAPQKPTACPPAY